MHATTHTMALAPHPAPAKILLVMMDMTTPNDVAWQKLLAEMYRRRHDVDEVILVPYKGRALKLLAKVQELAEYCQEDSQLSGLHLTVRDAARSHIEIKKCLLDERSHLGERDVYVAFT
jgi:hypothetical protein